MESTKIFHISEIKRFLSLSDFKVKFMFNVTASKSVENAVNYFRNSLAMGDYYSQKQQVIAQWHGKTAEHIGLERDVNADHFEALLRNRNPLTGEKLTPRDDPKRRAMYDITISPVKSVSVVHAITENDEIIAAHHEAVRKTMLEVEANIQVRLGTSGKGKGRHNVTTGNMVFAEFLHMTGRPTLQQLKSGEAYVPDPLIHSHCATPNVTFHHDQNRYLAIANDIIKTEAPYFEAIYHSEMRQLMHTIGYETYDTEKRWEIKGVPREVIDKFSNRQKEIELKAEIEDVTDPKYKATFAKLTANKKDMSVPESGLKQIWEDRLTLSEYFNIMNAHKGNNESDKTRANIDLDITPKKEQKPEPIVQKDKPKISAGHAINLALQHHMERNSGIQKKRVLEYAINLTSGYYSYKEINETLEKREDILSATNKQGIVFITTDWMNQQEEYLIERAAEGKATTPALNPDYDVSVPYFTKGQKLAVEHVLNSNDKIILVSGDAGTGKTTLLKEIQEGIKYGNNKLHMFAPSSDAAKNVLRKEGFENADTIARLLVDPRMQEQMKDSVIGIDEAGLVGVPTMNKLISIAEKQNARLLLSGDWKQHSSVEAGCAMKLIETKSEIKAARVDEIVRQRKAEMLKNVVEKMAYAISRKSEEQRQEQMKTAYDTLNDNGNIVEIKDRATRHERIANDYLEHTKKKGDNAIVISPSKKQVPVLTDKIRQKLREEGRIGKKDKDFYALRSKQFTNQEKQNPENYKQGDAVEFHRYVRGFKTGLHYVVKDIDKENVHIKSEEEEQLKLLPLLNKDKFEVYNKDEVQFARKDIIRITKNTKSLEGKALHNGQTYQIKKIDRQGDIILENGSTIPKTNHHIDHGYVSTSPASQGKTAKISLLSLDKSAGNAANDKQFYVSASRGSENCLVYTDDQNVLKNAVSKNIDGMSATEINQANMPPPQREFSNAEKEHYMNNVRSFYDEQIAPRYEAFKNKDYGHKETGNDIAEPQPS